MKDEGRRKNRIEAMFKNLGRKRRKAVIFYVTSGFPSLRGTARLIQVLGREGADLVEVGVPFSDPLADGPQIQGASVRALAKGVTLSSILSMVSKLRREVQIPLVLFSYYNPIYHMGLARFAQVAARAGVDGVIVPDLPPEEGGEFSARLKRRGIPLIFLLSPTSPSARIRLVGRRSRGFIYYVSRTGVTGVRSDLDAALKSQVRRVKRLARLPVVIGFGVSTPGQARRAAGWGDGVVVGSALIQAIERAKGAGWLKKARTFARRIVRAVNRTA